MSKLDYENLNEAQIFSKLAKRIFSPDLWSNREVKMLKKLGLSSWFGVGDYLDDDDRGDFFDDDWERRERKDDWL